MHLSDLPTRYVRTDEAALFLGLSRRTLEKHRTYGTGPAYRKLGGRVVYALADLEAWADQGKAKLIPDPNSQSAPPCRATAESCSPEGVVMPIAFADTAQMGRERPHPCGKLLHGLSLNSGDAVSTPVYLTSEEVIERYRNKISGGTLRNWRSKKIGPVFLKVGKTVLYPADELDRWDRSNLTPYRCISVTPSAMDHIEVEVG